MPENSIKSRRLHGFQAIAFRPRRVWWKKAADTLGVGERDREEGDRRVTKLLWSLTLPFDPLLS